MATEQLTANEQFFDAVLRHQIYLLRYSGSVRNQIYKILHSTEEAVADKILAKLHSMEPGKRKPVEWERLKKLNVQLRAIRMESWDKVRKFLEEEMVKLAYAEPIAISTALTAALPVVIETVMPSSNMLKSIALSRPFEGHLLKDWANRMAEDDIRRIQNAVQVGMVAGETNVDIVKRVIGTTGLKGTDGVTEMTRRQVEAVVRTAVMHVANNARSELLQENADIIEAERFVATLDSRTTPVCRGNDGKIFPLGKGPRPPLHYRCRSLRIAHMDGTLLGDRPAKSYTEKQLLREFTKQRGLDTVANRDELPYGTKTAFDQYKRQRIRQLVGPIPADTTYQSWLARQSKEFQEDVLGVTKAKLFRDGKLPLDRFVDRNGNELTLAELAVREKSAFKAAGLNPDNFD